MRKTRLLLVSLFLCILFAAVLHADEKRVELRFVPAPPGTGSIMFSAITTGPDGRIYEASANQPGQTAHLFVYDPKTDKVTELADIQKVVGEHGPKLAHETKVHTELVFDKRGILWFATASSEREADPGEFTEGYKGGHLISYDPATNKFTDHGILLPQLTDTPKDFWDMGEAIITMAIDPELDRLYMLTYPNAYFIVYDIPTGNYKIVGRTTHWPPFYVHLTTPRAVAVASDGRAFTIGAEGQVIMYDPSADKLPWLTPGEDYRKLFEKPGIHNDTGLFWLPLFIPGSDGIVENRSFQLAVDPTRTHIYGLGDAHSGYTGVFDLSVKPGKKPRIRKLGPTVPKGAKGWYLYASSITLGHDDNLYFIADESTNNGKTHIMAFSLKERKLNDLGVVSFPGYDESGRLITHGSTTGLDGTIYFGGEAPDVPHLGFSIYEPNSG